MSSEAIWVRSAGGLSGLVNDEDWVNDPDWVTDWFGYVDEDFEE